MIYIVSKDFSFLFILSVNTNNEEKNSLKIIHETLIDIYIKFYFV